MVESARSTRRAQGLKSLHRWHWISSALCLLGMLLFAVTGITLNHASQIESRPQVLRWQGRLTPDLKAALSDAAAVGGAKRSAPLPESLRLWLASQAGVDPGGNDAEWSTEEVYLSLPSPGRDAWLRIDPVSGEVESERSDRGWVSYLNDLHKGRNTGTAWRWFIDAFAVACLVFCVTGLLILKVHASSRPTTWPVVCLGLVIPLLLALLLIH